MKKIIIATIILLLSTYSKAQKDESIYLYRKDGKVNTFLKEDIDSIKYTCTDAQGNLHSTWQAQLIYTKDSTHHIPLENIDSLSFDGSQYMSDITCASNINLTLPNHSANFEFSFTTSNNLNENISNRFFTFDKVRIDYISTTEDGLYQDKYNGKYIIMINNTQKTISVPINYYGKDLFSIRVKYPVVTKVNDDGSTEIEKYMPEALQGASIKKDEQNFYILKEDGSIYKSYSFTPETPVETFVNTLLSDDEITEDFEIIKYDCSNTTMGDINNFNNIKITSLVDEIYFAQQTDQAKPTGKSYWDSYPTFIKKGDKGYEHKFKMSYRVVDNKITHIQISIDGMYVRFNNLSLETGNLKMYANTNRIKTVSNAAILPYKQTYTPLLSMQHNVVKSDEVLGKSLRTSTKRQREMLEYLKQKGFKAINFSECMSALKGETELDSPTYCLTFDDLQRNIWQDTEIRNLFNEYNAKPTLVYLAFYSSSLSSKEIPDYFLSKEEHKELKEAGWDFVYHGFTMYTGQLSYAQFKWGFETSRERWNDWYGEELTSYNPHGADLGDHQYHLLKNMGWKNITSTTSKQGWFCECGTTINIQYKRVGWMDSEIEWETVKKNIDEFAD